jgi:hypothetical protein
MAGKQRDDNLLGALSVSAARAAVSRAYRLLARLNGLISRLPAHEVGAVAAELFVPCERLDALGAYLERLTVPARDQPAITPGEQPVAPDSEAVPPT